MIAIIVLLGVTLNFSGSISYAVATLKGRAKPNRVTFTLWATAPLIAVAASFAQGGGWEVMPVLFAGLGPLLIVTASFFTRTVHWQLRRFDYLCGAFSILALVLWRLTHQPNIAILFAIISDTLAAVPTIRKAWTNPETESLWAYISCSISQVTAFLAAPAPSFAAYAFPIYLIVCCWLIISTVLYRRRIARS